MPWDRQARGRLEQQHGNEQRPRPGNLSALAGAAGYSERRKLVCHRRSRYKFRFFTFGGRFIPDSSHHKCARLPNGTVFVLSE
jgi:hypothetical protein